MQFRVDVPAAINLGEKKYLNKWKTYPITSKKFRINIGENLEHKESRNNSEIQTTLKIPVVQFLTIHKLETLFRNF